MDELCHISQIHFSACTDPVMNCFSGWLIMLSRDLFVIVTSRFCSAQLSNVGGTSSLTDVWTCEMLHCDLLKKKSLDQWFYCRYDGGRDLVRHIRINKDPNSGVYFLAALVSFENLVVSGCSVLNLLFWLERWDFFDFCWNHRILTSCAWICLLTPPSLCHLFGQSAFICWYFVLFMFLFNFLILLFCCFDEMLLLLSTSQPKGSFVKEVCKTDLALDSFYPLPTFGIYSAAEYWGLEWTTLLIFHGSLCSGVGYI